MAREVLVLVHVLRRSRKSEARMTTIPARWKTLASHACHLVLLHVHRIVSHLVDAGHGNLLSGLIDLSIARHYSSMLPLRSA
jgi:hypothetical protein